VVTSISLPLHHGKAPFWLLNRMKKLSKPIITIILEDFGEKEFFRRISNPIFFQSFSNVLGFDWNSSGVTTVLTGVLKSVLNNEEFEIRVAGGKGKNAISVPEQVKFWGEEIGLSDVDMENMIRISRFTARLDNNALQDGYDLYHHAIIFSARYWTVFQQGMNSKLKMARRYHFKPHRIKPISAERKVHEGIISERKEASVMNLTSEKSDETRKVMVDLLNDSPSSLKRDLEMISTRKRVIRGQSTLDGQRIDYLVPRRVNWRAIERVYELQLSKFDDVLLIDGMGKSTIRAIALIADLIYNTEYDRQDPAKYCFALGGKDGVPFPVDRKAYDEAIEFLKSVVEQSTIDSFEKKELFKRANEIQKKIEAV
jgi:hypothetical protein